MAQTTEPATSKKIDQALVGIWLGSGIDSGMGTIKFNWQFNRLSDGTFTAYYEILEGKDTMYVKDKGQWWVENNLLYEEHTQLKVLDVYQYKKGKDKSISFQLNSPQTNDFIKGEKFKEIKTIDRSNYFLDRIAETEAKILQQELKAYDQQTGFHHSPIDGIQDPRFVGVWKGADRDNQAKGTTKMWRMVRNSDGTFIIDFTLLEAGKTNKHTENGKWWVKGNKFYELHDSSGMVDVYDFEIIDEKKIKFKSIDLPLEPGRSNYEFIDMKSR